MAELRGAQKGGKKKNNGGKAVEAEATLTKKAPPKKEGRSWGKEKKLSKQEAAALDRSADVGEQDSQQSRAVIAAKMREKFGSVPEVGESFGEEWMEVDESSEESEGAEEEKEDTKASSGLFSMFSTLIKGKELTKADLEPVMENIYDKLVGKNVAQDIAEKLVESVSASLVGTRQPSFTRLKTVASAALEKTLTKVLTPKRNVNILQGIADAKKQNRPYTICFVGVNGVGKSTSLAKVTAYLRSKGKSVGIAACDTFRSGAIEQLKTHASALDVTLYQSGYNKDAAAVATYGIRQAQKDGTDVCLIDTAGRMQDNEPLMRALSKLIIVNNPDLVLFVGEALVGNDGVDQLTKFNEALVNLSSETVPRTIDGIVLTKFDTIDDKVGAAISMTYASGAPIVFVGVGQQYRDIRLLNAAALLKKLLR
jgi:signal recognition particle receptor subunit alpha